MSTQQHARPARGWTTPALLAVVLGLGGERARAAEPQADAVTLDRIQVTASRTPRDRHETAASISIVEGTALDTDSIGATLAEHLATVPGVLARNRQNYAQDEQISIRGFGTRATFGIRSVRLYVDGVPATMPDGQGQVSHFPLASAERIEVLRGPFSALYGNSAGGVIQVFTGDGGEPGGAGAELVAGSFGQRRAAAHVRGAAGGVDYIVGASHFSTDGWRDHSRARRTGINAKLRTSVAGGELTLLANGFRSPDTQDPQGLTRGQYEADPQQASAGALRFDIRKTARQAQGGIVFERPLPGGDALRLLAYGGRRDIEQILSTPVEPQRNPLSAGGWIDLEAPFAGFDARWTGDWRIAGAPVELVAGLAAETQTQHRSGYENFVGGTLGVRGALRLRQDDRVRSVDPYLQATWRLDDAWTLVGGLRHSTVTFESRDRYVTAANPDDSGEVRHRALSPVFGATRELRDGVSVFASAGRGFETPTFNELGYRPDGGSGLNFQLEPMRTRSMEAGIRIDGRVRAEAALFRSDTRDELAVNASSGGRTTFRNAGRARRTGFEAAFDVPLGAAWRLRMTGTWLDARYRDAFRECTTCADATDPVPAGTRIPGVPRTQLQAALRYRGAGGWHVQLDGQHVGDVTVNTRGDERAAGYSLFGASLGYAFERGGHDGRVFAGVANLFDRRHVGSVIVNESNRRYFEPGAGRSIVFGVELR